MRLGDTTRRVRVVAAFAACVVACGLGGCSMLTPPLSEATQSEARQAVSDENLVTAGTLTVAVDMADAPQVVLGNDGSPQGYLIDVAAVLADEMGLELALVDAPSASVVEDGAEADIFIGATTSSTSGGVAVMGEVYQNATAVFGSGALGTSSLTASDLANARIGVQDGSSSQEALARAGVVASDTFSNVNECFEALAAGDVDYVACDATAGGFLARSYDGVYFAGTLSSSTSYGIACAASARGLSDEVAGALEGLAADGTLDAIHRAWYGPVPLNLSSEVVSGVTLPTADEQEAAESGDDGMITDDINSL